MIAHKNKYNEYTKQIIPPTFTKAVFILHMFTYYLHKKMSINRKPTQWRDQVKV